MMPAGDVDVTDELTTMPADQNEAKVPRWLYFVILVILAYPTYAWQRYHNVNESARLYLVRAMVEQQVLDIDVQIGRYGDLHDKAEAGGHYYCDKAVGLSFSALPFCFLMERLGRLFDNVWSLEQMRYVLTVFCVTVPTILLLSIMGRYWRKSLDHRHGFGWIVISFSLLAYALATPAGVYATQFMGHQLAAVVLFIHFVFSRRFDRTTCARRLLWAGLFTGVGAMVDFTSGVLHAIIVLSYLFRVRWDWRLVMLACGGVIGFAPQLIYNTLCFGGPFQFAYGYEALPEFRELHGKGFLGVTYPRWESFVGLLFESRKGLFFLSPFLLLGFVGLIARLRDSARRGESIVMLVLVVTGMGLAMSVHDWLAGLTVGPRHMVSILPFLMTGVVWAVAEFRWLRVLYVGLVLPSIAIILLTLLTMPAYEVNFANPVTGQVLFLIRGGFVAPNLASAMGLSPVISFCLPLILVAGVLIFLLIRSEAVSLPRSMTALAVTAAYSLIVLTWDPDPPPKTASFRGSLLYRTDHVESARVHMEQTLARWPDVRTAGQIVPELLRIHAESADRAAAERTLLRWLEIDPANDKARLLYGKIAGGS